MFTAFVRSFGCMALLFTCCFPTVLQAKPHAQAKPDVQADTFVHLFEWRWPDIATECEHFLGPNGYHAVQVSPPSEHRAGPQWWTRYQPVSYELISRSGDRAEFTNMVQRCNAAGVDIYVDAVINHMAAGSGRSLTGTPFTRKQFPDYTPGDFHPDCGITNYRDRNNVQQCELVGLADLKTEAPDVQARIAAYLSDLVNIGVAGFRIDASKHMAANDIKHILAQVQGAPWVFQEVIDQGGEPIRASEYTGNGAVTEFHYSLAIGEAFGNGTLASLRHAVATDNWLVSGDAVVFVDNHDNQRGHGGGGHVITFVDGALYDLANVFMLSWPYGYPKVMSSYAFQGDTDAGPPSLAVHASSQPACFEDTWQCEHRRPVIAGAVDFRRNTADQQRVTNWWDNGGNQIAFGRGSAGFVVINAGDTTLSTALESSMAPGRYCNILNGKPDAETGQCRGQEVLVDERGRIQVAVPALSAIAIHHNAKPGG
ncbi:alpha-amylase family protein [Aestuariibacter sp. GS-14]|uniref:alpha-amylase n=1 Tax=Aestuariibacter sp. GS-14 TaxID=2590670 RepID=UPI003514453E